MIDMNKVSAVVGTVGTIFVDLFLESRKKLVEGNWRNTQHTTAAERVGGTPHGRQLVVLSQAMGAAGWLEPQSTVRRLWMKYM